MTNHYHLEVGSPEGPLSKPIQWLNQNHANYINRTYGRDGRHFKGRFKSAAIQADAHLHELTRYIHLNPVRAGMVTHPGDYPWSSHRAFLGLQKAPSWPSVDAMLKRFGRRNNLPRDLALYRARLPSRLGWADLGQHFGGVGANAAGMACKRMEQELARRRALREKVSVIDSELHQAREDEG